MNFILKSGLRELNRHQMIGRMNLILLVVTFVSGMLCVSTVWYQTRYYRAIHKLASGEGVFVLTEGLTCEDGMTNMKDSAELERVLQGTKVSSFCYCATPYVIKDNALDYYQNIIYDDACIKAFIPELSEGKWFSDGDVDQEIEAVVSASAMDIHPGDILTVIHSGKEVGQVRVIGVLKDGEAVIGRANHYDAVNGFSYHNMYAEYSAREEKPTVFLSRSNLETVQSRTGEEVIESELSGGIFVQYPERITDAKREEYKTYLSDHIMAGGDKCVEFGQIEESGKAYLKDVLMQQFPVWLCSFVVTAVSIVCIELTSIKASLRDFAIYSICGCAKKSICQIPLAEMLMLNIAAFLVSIVIVEGCSWAGLIQHKIIEFRVPMIWYCLAVMLLMILLASWYPAYLWKKQSIKEILRVTESGEYI